MHTDPPDPPIDEVYCISQAESASTSPRELSLLIASEYCSIPKITFIWEKVMINIFNWFGLGVHFYTPPPKKKKVK